MTWSNYDQNFRVICDINYRSLYVVLEENR